MSLSPISQTIPVNTIGSAWNTLARLATPPRAQAQEQIPLPNTPASTILSQEQLRAALIGAGINVDDDMLMLADTFSRLGAPIDEATLTAARTMLARLPDVKPAAIALSNLLDIGNSPAAIQALSRFLTGLPSDEAAGEVASILSVAVGPEINKTELAQAIRTLVEAMARSTENRLLSGIPMGLDARVKLLTLARALDSRQGQAALEMAGHLAAQQLMNRTAVARFDPPAPLYFAFYLQEPGGKRLPAEMQVWTRPDDPGNGRNRENADALNATIRVSPDSLGTIQAVLNGTYGGQMRCILSAERLLTFRLIRRAAPELAAALTATGWDVTRMDVTQTSDYPPLWYGGVALAQPRSRLDRKA